MERNRERLVEESADDELLWYDKEQGLLWEPLKEPWIRSDQWKGVKVISEKDGTVSVRLINVLLNGSKNQHPLIFQCQGPHDWEHAFTGLTVEQRVENWWEDPQVKKALASGKLLPKRYVLYASFIINLEVFSLRFDYTLTTL